MLLIAGDSALLIVDVQEKLEPAMFDPAPAIENCATLTTVADRLDVPTQPNGAFPLSCARTDRKSLSNCV